MHSNGSTPSRLPSLNQEAKTHWKQNFSEAIMILHNEDDKSRLSLENGFDKRKLFTKSSRS